MTHVTQHHMFRSSVAVVTMLGVLGAACSSSNDSAAGGDSISVVAAFYPVATAAEAIGGDCVDVENLTPPGVEPHDLELTPDDVEAIASADVVLYLGSGFQPAVEDAIGDAQGSTLDILTLADTLPAPPSEAEEGILVDPHVWLDPGLLATMMPGVAQTLSTAAPDSDCDFEANAETYAGSLTTIDEEFTAGLASCDQDLIVTNHAAFGYLAAAYGLTQEAISGLAPDEEPSPARLAELKDLVEASGVTTIFTEELVSPEVAETLASEAGVDTAVLNTLEGLTPEEIDAGEDYGSIMRTNLETLRAALGCS